jgi:hypothetical protein
MIGLICICNWVLPFVLRLLLYAGHVAMKKHLPPPLAPFRLLTAGKGLSIQPANGRPGTQRAATPLASSENIGSYSLGLRHTPPQRPGLTQTTLARNVHHGQGPSCAPPKLPATPYQGAQSRQQRTLQRMEDARPSLSMVDMALPHGFPREYKRFIYSGGSVYRASFKPPEEAFVQGWTKTGGYADIVRHMTENQGIGSAWISCCRDMMATKDLLMDYGGTYGTYLYEVELDNYQAIDAELAYCTIRHKMQSPFFWQKEVAAFERIRGDQVIAVWVKRSKDVLNSRKEPSFAGSYERMTRHELR